MRASFLPSLLKRMMPCMRALLVALVLSVLAGSLAQAQETESQADRYRLASEYMQAGEYESATAILEDLYAESPETHAFYRSLKEAYEGQRDYEAAVALIDDRMEREGATPDRMIERAELLHRQGDESAASEAWMRAIDLAPDQVSTYRTVYESLEDTRRFEQAIEVLQQGREVLDEPGAFRSQLADLYNQIGEHARATEEYLAFLDESPNRLRFVQRRLESFVSRNEEARATSIEAAESAVEANAENATFQLLLAWLYMEDENYRAAFDTYRTVDRLTEGEGQRLLRFARQSLEAEAYDIAIEAYETILNEHPDTPGAAEARRNLGDLYERWAGTVNDPEQTRAYYERALEAYRTYLDAYPEAPERDEALRQVATIQLEELGDLDAARTTLERIIESHSDTDAADQSQFDLGRIALQQGALDEAADTFESLASRLGTGDLAERARYEQARIDFYRGDFDEASEALRRIAPNTSEDVANNAIELDALILQNRGPDSLDTPLQLYSEAELQYRQRDHTAALATLDTLTTNHARHSLIEDALFLRAQILEDAHEIDEAAEAYSALADLHPRSPLADRALFHAAELHAEHLDDSETAIDYYMRLLDDYPDSMYASQTRSQIQALRGPRR